MRNSLGSIVALALGALATLNNVRAEEGNFNAYVLKAVEQISREHPSQGYANKAYTHDIPYANGVAKATGAPMTMCVAAVAEIMITAINLYVKETNDSTPYNYFPVESWNKMRPKDIRAHLWVDPKLDSYGTADALETFGVGKRVPFKELQPGSFINLNRLNRSGHAVVFLGFIDNQGKVLSQYSDKVRGFKYFSSQGNGHNGDAGFAYRYAFFSYNGVLSCPDISSGKRDCGVIWSAGQKMLNTGFMLPPSKWNKAVRDKNIALIEKGLFKQTRAIGGGFIGFDKNISESAFYKNIETIDTMKLGPAYELSNETTDF